MQSDKGIVRQFAQWISEPNRVQALQNEVTRLAQENMRLRTVMLAAHQEIVEHWESHCDEGGYAPQSLIRHLRDGTGYYPGYVEEISKQRES
jgi:hypothetical protein